MELGTFLFLCVIIYSIYLWLGKGSGRGGGHR